MLKEHNRTIWTDSPLSNTAFIHEYMANSMQKESPEMDRIRAAVKKAQMFVVLGYSERAGGSLYIAQVSRNVPSYANRAYYSVVHRSNRHDRPPPPQDQANPCGEVDLG